MPENAIKDVAGYTETAASGGILLTIAAAVLMGPIAEEIAFRGFMTTRLKMRFPVWFAVALSTLAFSAGHYTGGIGQLIGTAWTGLLFCLVFLWTKSLRASIFAHILNNAVGFLMPEAVFAEMGLPVKLVLLVVGLAVT
ncbi:MAG: CPBP family intramembrane metalloprotease, partial [Clostridiales bacterium]|nr:CPBP family intramembrane metalloprotease [Clostridiales bacterium]